MSDDIDRLGQSLIQHGKYNDRIYLMKLAREDLPGLLQQLDHLAEEHRYSKIFAKVQKSAQSHFTNSGYVAEAEIPGFFGGREEVIFFGKYLTEERSREQQPALVRDVLTAARAKADSGKGSPLPGSYRLREAGPQHVAAMAELYRQVFATYPFPIHDAEYLRRTMTENVAYFGIWHKQRLVALSSAEMDPEGLNAEMTDFATLPAYRGKGLANHLLADMERHLAVSGFKTAYTIARAYSYGMNITFARQGYCFSGTLTNNTNIFGGLESMNVWYKPLLTGKN